MASASDCRIRVAIIENDPLRLIGLRSFLSSEPNFEVWAGTVATVTQDPEEAVVLLGGRNSRDVYNTLAELRNRKPDIRIIVTGAGNSDEDIFQAITAGAKGYIHEAAPAADFKHAIRVVHGGLVWAPRRVLSMFVERTTATPRVGHKRDVVFTERELEVLQLLIEGRPNREIGAALGIEPRTVKAHIAHLMNKAGVHNRIALSVYAITCSILPKHK